MTLKQVIERVEAAASAEPCIRSIVRNDVFRLNTIADCKYGVFAWVQRQHSITDGGDIARYSFSFIYVDRLTSDHSNEIEVQSTGMSALHGILLRLADVMGVGEESFTAFTQRFGDECAGVFCNVTLETEADTICDTDYSLGNETIIY